MAENMTGRKQNVLESAIFGIATSCTKGKYQIILWWIGFWEILGALVLSLNPFIHIYSGEENFKMPF
jgi:hypothetical protein